MINLALGFYTDRQPFHLKLNLIQILLTTLLPTIIATTLQLQHS